MSLLQNTIQEIGRAMGGNLSGSQLEGVQDTIKHYAIASAVAGAVSGLVPGAGVLAVLTQTGLVWASYVKINQHLGISMKENTAKFIASAIGTNILTNAGMLIISYAAAAIISFIPILGQVAAATASAGIGYILVYTAAVIYLKLIIELVQPDGTINVEETIDTKRIIKRIIEENNLKKIIEEGRDEYKQAKEKGIIDDAIKNRRCPNCQQPVEAGQKFCSNCGSALC